MKRAEVVSDRAGDRTRGLRIKSPLLYQLSYPVAMRRNFTSRRARYKQRHLPPLGIRGIPVATTICSASSFVNPFRRNAS